MIEIYCKNIFTSFLKNYKLYGFYDESLTIKDLKILILQEINKNKFFNEFKDVIIINNNKYQSCNNNEMKNIEFINEKYQFYHDNKKLKEIQFNSKLYLNYYVI